MLGWLRVGDEYRMVGVQLACGRVDEVAALGDGQGDDANGRVGQLVHHLGELVHTIIVDEGAYHTATVRHPRTLLDHRWEQSLSLINI